MFLVKFFIPPGDEREGPDGLLWDGCVAVALAPTVADAQRICADGLAEIGGSPAWLEVADLDAIDLGALHLPARVVTLLET